MHLKSEVETQIKLSYLSWKFLQNQVGFWRKREYLPVAVKIAPKKSVLLVRLLLCELKIVLVCGFVHKNEKKNVNAFFFYFFVKMKENTEWGGRDWKGALFLPFWEKSRSTFSIPLKKKVFNERATFTFFYDWLSEKKSSIRKCMCVIFVQISNHHFLSLHLTFVRINFHISTKKGFFFVVTRNIEKRPRQFNFFSLSNSNYDSQAEFFCYSKIGKFQYQVVKIFLKVFISHSEVDVL